MATNYNFTLPTVGGSANTWGTSLNANWTLLTEVLDGTHATLVVNIDNYTADGLTITNNNASTDPTTITCETITIQGKVTEEIYALGTSGTQNVDPDNGTIQTIAMTGNVTIGDGLSNGEFATLRFTSVGTDSVSWPTMQWIGGAEPTLSANNHNWVHLWKVGGTLYGSYIGSSSAP